MGILTQFYLLQYKNWKLQFRKKAVTVFEILIPVLLCLLMVSIRTLVKVTEYPDAQTFPSYDVNGLPNTTVYSVSPFIQTLGLAYTPKTPITNQIMAGVHGYLHDSINGPSVILGPMVDEKTMEETLTFSNDSANYEAFYLGGIVFENPEDYKTEIPKNISYKIRFRYNLRATGETASGAEWNTRQVFPDFIIPGPQGGNFSDEPNYYDEGFLSVQHALHRSVIDILNPSNDMENYTTHMERFPYPPYTDDIFLVILQLNFPFFIMLCMIFFSLNIPKEVTQEKELKLKESMRMMGMANWLQWLAWFVKYFVFLLFTTFLMTLILSPPYQISPRLTVIQYADFVLMWVFFMLYAVSIICYCFMISAFFNKANASAAAGGIIFFLSYIPYSFLSPRYDTLSAMTKLVSCLDLNMAMSFGINLISRFEGAGSGVQWNNINEPVSVDDNITFGQILLMFVADSVLYILIMWYVEAVFPGTYGIPQKPWFFVLPSYWCGTKQADTSTRGSKVDIADIKPVENEFIEPDPVNMTAGIQIKELTKKFKVRGKTKTAVDKLSLNMYDGQITALLGHNGAGKTTTMFMLTGFIPPSGGTALVNGYDIRKDIANVRSSLGLCPQHDILFDNLTVEEHLYFFAKLKDCPPGKIQEQIDYYLKTLGIAEKRSAFTSTLSGGQKRKLSVGIALIGDSKIVILDEPTSGMDPSARRHMWDVLQEQRKGRTMILSTHFMDEADHLGDRIAILSDGVVQCCGSSLFLKKKYGAGYHMVMTKSSGCDVDKVNTMLTKHIPEAKMESNVGAELSYILPDDKVSAFPSMFAELEESKDDLGILGFGASVTTMEEVFIKVGEGHETEEEEKIEESMKGISNVTFNSDKEAIAINGEVTDEIRLDDKALYEREKRNMEAEVQPASIKVDVSDLVKNFTHNIEKQTGCALFAAQFKAMFYKRVIYTLRNKLLTVSQIILPLFFTALTVLIMKTSPSDVGIATAAPLNLNMFGKTDVLYTKGVPPGSVSDDVQQAFVNQFSASSFSTHTTREVGTDLRDEIISVAEDSLKDYNYKLIMTASFNETQNNGSDITIIFNPTPFHAAPTALLLTDTALLHHYVNDSYTFAATNHPLPQSARSEIETEANDAFNGSSFAYSANMMFGFSFLAASFVVFLITERARKIKHSQIVSGVKWYNFWLSTFTWDFINYLIPSLLTVIVFAISKVDSFASIADGNKQPAYIIVLMIMYGMAFLPNMYLLQFMFTGPATGYVVMAFFNLLTGLFPVLVISILLAIESTRATGKVLDWIFIVILPNYNMGQGIGNIYNNYEYLNLCFNKFPEAFGLDKGKESLDDICELLDDAGSEFPCCKGNCGGSCLDWQEDYFDWNSLGIGRNLLFLAVQTVFFWLLIIMIETEVIRKMLYMCRPKKEVTEDLSEVQEDDDVLAEKEKVQVAIENQQQGENQVVISGLTKYFLTRKAVNDVSLAIPKGECFGLLGVNGAGKTTTFKMLTGDETISGGTAYMAGKNIRKDIHQVQKTIGYCPQFDALIDQMTGEEMLYMYARLRGVPEPNIPGIVDDLLTALLLNKHKKKYTRDYSGGNKRKLSTAIALMGDPPIVFLDEPTTGMDPVARRMLWQALSKVRDSGKTLILTSHSMEECEALCTRMAIMVNGKYKCLGSTQHLKNKFGAGYTLIARVSYPPDGGMPDIKAVENFVDENFPGSHLKDKHQNLVQYHIDKGELTWATVFKKLEENKEQLCIEDYSVSQTTLEQVFINFARAQVPPDDDKPSLGRRIKQTCCICCIPEYVVATHVPIKSYRNLDSTIHASPTGPPTVNDTEENMVNGKAST